MNAGLSTQPHPSSLPQAVTPPAPAVEERRPLTQRELVAMSLIACPNKRF